MKKISVFMFMLALGGIVLGGCKEKNPTGRYKDVNDPVMESNGKWFRYLSIRHMLEFYRDPCLPGEELHRAALYGCPSAVRMLIAGGKDVDFVNGFGDTPLHCAMECRFIRGHFFTKKDVKDFMARRADHFKVIKLLAESGADVNIVSCSDTNCRRITPLMNAALNNDEELVSLLCLSGARVDDANPEGKTALHMALIHGCVEVAKTLVLMGADKHLCDVSGKSAYDFLESECADALTVIRDDAGRSSKESMPDAFLPF